MGIWEESQGTGGAAGSSPATPSLPFHQGITFLPGQIQPLAEWTSLGDSEITFLPSPCCLEHKYRVFHAVGTAAGIPFPCLAAEQPHPALAIPSPGASVLRIWASAWSAMLFNKPPG